MKAKILLAALCLILMLVSASAFVIQAKVAKRSIGGVEYYALKVPATGSNEDIGGQPALDLSQGEPGISIPALTELGGLDFFQDIGDYTITLKAVEPMVNALNGNCSQRCCTGGTGPKINLRIADSTGVSNIFLNDMVPVHRDYSSCSSLSAQQFMTNKGLVRVRAKFIQAPVFEGRQIDGKTYYIMKDGEIPSIGIELCILLKKKDGSWTECLGSLEEFAALASQEQTPEETPDATPEIPTATPASTPETTGSEVTGSDATNPGWIPPLNAWPGPFQEQSKSIFEQILQNTTTVTGSVDNAAASTQAISGKVAELPAAGETLEVTVTEEKEFNSLPIAGARVKITAVVEGETVVGEADTGEDGKALLSVPVNTEVQVTASKANYVATVPVNVTVTGTGKATVVLRRNPYNLKVVFARDDFWKFFYEVAPKYHNAATTPMDTTTKSFLDSHVPTKEQYGYVYDVASQFMKLKTKKCDDASGTEIAMELDTANSEGAAITDYRGYLVKLNYVMVFPGLKLAETYYVCYDWPVASGSMVREVRWQIGLDGTLSEPDPARDIKS